MLPILRDTAIVRYDLHDIYDAYPVSSPTLSRLSDRPCLPVVVNSLFSVFAPPTFTSVEAYFVQSRTPPNTTNLICKQCYQQAKQGDLFPFCLCLADPQVMGDACEYLKEGIGQIWTDLQTPLYQLMGSLVGVFPQYVDALCLESVIGFASGGFGSCTRCAADHGFRPFPACRRSKGMYGGACSNCIWAGKMVLCPLYRVEKRAKKRRVHNTKRRYRHSRLSNLLQ